MEPTPAARTVRLVEDRSVVATCRLIADVKGGQYAPVVGAVAHTIDNARTQLREDAARQGANVVVITQRVENAYGTWMYGEAYACASP
jgi:uncharacterized protein DUF4156